MGLNIKNERVHQLARRAAELTGRSQTSAIEEALIRLLADLGHDPASERARERIDAAQRIALEYQRHEGDNGRTIRQVDDLYDTRSGLPR